MSQYNRKVEMLQLNRKVKRQRIIYINNCLFFNILKEILLIINHCFAKKITMKIKIPIVSLFAVCLTGSINLNAQTSFVKSSSKSTIQLQAAPGNPTIINDLSKSKIKHGNNKALTVCGTDTSTYPLTVKATGFQALSLNNATSAYVAGQYYNAADSITINGFDFYAWKPNATNGVTISVNAELYLAGPDSFPIGAPLATQSVVIDTTFGGGVLTSLIKSATFTNPVTVTQPYIVLISNNSATGISMLSNSYTSGNGQGEDLSILRIGANYLKGSSVNIGAATFNADWLIHPYVEYSLDANLSFNPDSLYSAPSVINVRNTSTSFINDRMYDLATAAGLGGISHTYDFGIGAGSVQVQGAAVTYPTLQNYTVTLIDTLRQYNGGECISSTSKVLAVGFTRIDSSDAAVIAVQRLSEYNQIPANQSINGIVFAGAVRNLGTDTLVNVELKYTVSNSGLNVFSDSTVVSFIAPGDDSVFVDFSSFIPSANGVYVVDYVASSNNTDVDLSNNSLSTDTLIIGGDFMARDNNVATGALSIGAGTTGELGSIYETNISDTLTTVSVMLSNVGGNMTNQPVSANIRSLSNGLPGAIIASSDTLLFPNAANTFIDLTFNNAGGYVVLPADSFFVGIVEGDSALTVATSMNKFTANTGFVTFGTTPWTPNENFNFVVTYMIRPTFGVPNLSVGIQNEKAESANLLVYPNPSTDVFNLLITDRVAKTNIDLRVIDIQGKTILNKVLIGGNVIQDQIDLTSFGKGIYFIQLNTNEGIVNRKVILK